MLPQLLAIRAFLLNGTAATAAVGTTLTTAVAATRLSLWQQFRTAVRESLHATPTLHETLYAIRTLLTNMSEKLFHAMQLTTFSSVYGVVSGWLLRVAKICIEALDWLLLPRLSWKITMRHCFALLVLYFVKVFWTRAVIPILSKLYQYSRPFFINAEYLKQEKLLQDQMDHARTYTEWKKAASSLDRLQGRYHWKESSQSLHYDWRRIRDDLQRFRELVDTQDVRGIMTFSRSRLLRNLVGINDRRLYTHLRAGTKRLIEEYISEVVRALQLVCVIEGPVPVKSPSNEGDDYGAKTAPLMQPVSTAEKLSFFNETRHAFGRSALLLSGGATLGLYHIGVCKSLHHNHLLPRVLSGSSVGSIFAAMIGTRTDEELVDLFNPDAGDIKLNFFPPNGGSARRKLTRLFTQGVLMDIKILKRCVKANVPPLTFQEAYELSGRIINIVVSPAAGTGNKDSLRLLNYLTAPNVLVWSAALASCAIPGVYAPVELLKKDEKTGLLTPYMEGGSPIKWEDGSVQADLPMQRLSELFNINHFIVSQVNPHVVPFISSASSTHTLQQSFLAAPLPKLIDYLSSQLKCTALNFLHLNMMPIHPSVKYILDQKYLGDITLVPDVSPLDYTQLLVNPTPERLKECIYVSEQSSWKLIPTIRGACEIEFTLDECVRRMRGTLILEELDQAKKSNRNKDLSRVRSWSSDLLSLPKRHPSSVANPRESDHEEESDELAHQHSIAARTQSQHNLLETDVCANSSNVGVCRANRLLNRKRSDGQGGSSQMKRAHTVLALPHMRPERNHQHQPEADDEVSDEELDEEEERRKSQQAGSDAATAASHMSPDHLQHEGEGEVRFVDDEGIMRPKRALSVPNDEAVFTANEESLYEPNESDSGNNSGGAPSSKSTSPKSQPVANGPSTTTPALETTSTEPIAPVTDAVVDGLAQAALGTSTCPAVSSNRSPSTTLPNRVNVFSPDTTQTITPPAIVDWSRSTVMPSSTSLEDKIPGEASPPTIVTTAAPAAFSTRINETDNANNIKTLSPSKIRSPPQSTSSLAARQTSSTSSTASSTNASLQRRRSVDSVRTVVPHMTHSKSRPLTPSGDSDEVKLSEAEWNEEKNSARLAQLLKTTQTKVSVQSPVPPPKRNTRSTLKPKKVGDVSLHIPSLVSFRHTPPRRMSTMDLALLDSSDHPNNTTSPKSMSSHRVVTKPTPPAPMTESDEDELDHSAGEQSDVEGGGTIHKWLTRASSFFRRESDPTPNVTCSTSGDVTVCSETNSPTHSPLATSTDASANNSPTVPTRSATHQHLAYLSSANHVMPAQQQPIGSPATRTRSHPPLPRHTVAPSATGSASTTHLDALKSGRFKTSLSTSPPNVTNVDSDSAQPILRAASHGLPRTLSQLELISDVTTMP